MPWPMTRAMASFAPPAAVGTTRVIDFSGKAAAAFPHARDAASATAATRWVFWNFNCLLRWMIEIWMFGRLLLGPELNVPLFEDFCELHVYDRLMHTVDH
ncbi:hypothetical protein J2739_002242 [Variovorax soli]|uniref:Uncharacterized protein n=1 Tax=Variovorax soli TaxID=376815 RepID=A0ABU1NDC4_9BURK|nr:hypothetical protein [Variovorax soli]